MKPDITICKATEAAALVRDRESQHLPFHAVISIEHPCDTTVSTADGRAPRLATEIGPEWSERQLILVCWDLEKPDLGFPAPGPDIVQQGIAHAQRWCPPEEPFRLLVHCKSGKSRSTALALVLLRHFSGPGTEQSCLNELLRIRPVAAPNIAIVRHGDAVLKCGGELVRVVESDSAITIRRLAVDVVRRRYLPKRPPDFPPK